MGRTQKDKRFGNLDQGCCDFTLDGCSSKTHAFPCHQNEALDDCPDEIFSSDRKVQVNLLDCVSSLNKTKRKSKSKRNVSRWNASDQSTSWDVLDKESTSDENEITDDVSCGIYPEPRMSRFQNFPCGSKSIVCPKERVIFIMVWTVSPTDLSSSLTAVPVINNSGYDDRIITSIIDEITPMIKSTVETSMHCPSFEDAMEHAIVVCEQMSAYIASMENDIINMFSERLMTNEGKDKHITIREKRQRPSAQKLKSGLRKFDITPGESVDYFGLYLDTIQYDLNNIFRAETRIDKNQMDSEDCCPICLEDLGQNGLEFSKCGHKACPSCWRDLIKAAASSGDAIICCPAYKCMNRIGIHDMAQIELGLNAMEMNERRPLEDSSRLLVNLVRFRIDNYILTNPTSKQPQSEMHFCTTPSCNNVFVPKNMNFNGIDENSFNGSNIHFCVCGTSRCGDCYHDSHFGLRCEEFSRVKKEIESDRMDSEIRSLKWVASNTSPCPKCRFPINKNGGCNHVRCSKCEYYFCWNCGGDGSICGAFFCHNKGRANEEDSTEELSTHIDILSEYSDTREKLNISLRRVKNDESSMYVALEVQLRQTLVWARLHLISALLKNATRQVNDLLKAVHRIELGVDVLMMRCHDEEKDLIKVIQGLLENDSSKRTVENEDKAFKKKYSMEQLINISNMLSMTFERFSSYSTTMIADVIRILKNGQPTKTRRIYSASRSFVCSPLNNRAKRENHGWKSQIESLEQTGAEEEVIENERRARWKGKDRSRARRDIIVAMANL